MDEQQQPTVKEELTKLVVNRFPKIGYKECVTWVTELELELKRLRDLQVEEEKNAQ